MDKRVALQTCVVDNYGGLLQAYALKKAIEKLGFDCDILPFLRYEDSGSSFFQTLKSLLLSMLLGKKRKNHIPFSKKRRFNCFRFKYLRINTDLTRDKDFFISSNKNYKIYVCGSDLIWNPLLRKDNLWYDMLGFVNDSSIRIAYAPSIGITRFPDELIAEAKKYLSKFAFLSCREDEGVNLLRNTFGLQSKHVLDPTMLFDKHFWTTYATRKYSSNYCFIYVFDKDPIDNLLNKILLETELDIVTTSFENVFDKKLKHNRRIHLENRKCGPFEFVGFIANASFVICNSFHGTAFSINMNVPFITFQREDASNYSVNSRLRSLCKMFDVQERLLNRDIDLQTISFDTLLSLDFDTINRILALKREESFMFLSEALNAGKD